MKDYIQAYIQKHANSDAEQNSDNLSDRIISDIIKGAQANRKCSVQNATSSEVKLASAGLTPLVIAQTAGALQALSDAEFTIKEASEVLQLPTDILLAVIDAAV